MPPVAPVRVLRRNAQTTFGVAWIALLLAAGCGASQPAIVQTPSRAQHVDATGLRVVSIPRPTADVVRVSLWIDAGSRDADPPQLATLSAWAAAATAGPEVHARALPDATEIWVDASAADIGSAVASLARALATRDADEAVLATLRQRLTEQRARQELDGSARAEQAAFSSALGDAQAATFFPFGSADDDDQLTRDHVASFLGDHFGPNRAALLAVGDVRASLLSQAIGSHITGLPRARATRTPRGLDVATDTTDARVDRARHGAAAVAVVSADHDAVASTLTAVRQRWAAFAPEVRWMAVRGGAIGVAVARTSEPLPAIRAALDAAQTSEGMATALPREDLAALSERAGLELCAPAAAAPSHAVHLGVAATSPESARSSPEEEPRAQARITSMQRELQRVIDDAARTPRYRGEVGAQVAHVVLENGARIVVQRRDSEQVGIAISFLGGASEEHHTHHGRTALLALLSAQACEGMGAGALSARLRAIGATLSPVLEASAFGLRLSAPRDQWRASLDLVTRCALRPLLNRRLLRDAQARMLESLSNTAPRGRATQLADVLSPVHPGNVALWGSVDSALLDLDVIARAHTHATVGSRMAIAIVGNVPVDEVVRTAAKRLAGQPAGALPQAAVAVIPPPGVSTAFNDGPSAMALLGFGVALPDPDPVGARVFAASLADALVQTPGIELTWLDAGHFPTGAWAGLGLQLPLETLETLNDTVAKALHQLASPAGRTQVRRLIERAVAQQTRLRSEPVHEAAWLVDRALQGVQSDTNVGRAEHTFDTFVRTRPHYLVSRGNAARVSNNAAASRP